MFSAVPTLHHRCGRIKGEVAAYPKTNVYKCKNTVSLAARETVRYRGVRKHLYGTSCTRVQCCIRRQSLFQAGTIFHIIGAGNGLVVPSARHCCNGLWDSVVGLWGDAFGQWHRLLWQVLVWQPGVTDESREAFAPIRFWYPGGTTRHMAT